MLEFEVGVVVNTALGFGSVDFWVIGISVFE